jgi:APA family basic amino acid/polyamine antiporter
LRRRLPRGSFRLPGGPLVPVAAVLMCIAVLSTATARNLLAAAVALAVGAVIYALGRGGQAAPRAG